MKFLGFVFPLYQDVLLEYFGVLYLTRIYRWCKLSDLQLEGRRGLLDVSNSQNDMGRILVDTSMDETHCSACFSISMSFPTIMGPLYLHAMQPWPIITWTLLQFGYVRSCPFLADVETRFSLTFWWLWLGWVKLDLNQQ